MQLNAWTSSDLVALPRLLLLAQKQDPSGGELAEVYVGGRSIGSPL